MPVEVGSYSEGVEIAQSLIALDGPNVNPVCGTRVFTHGHRTRRALVLLHGFTNCPQQFDALGRRFFERGWNVLIPRYPRHGYTDRLTTSIAELRSEQLIAVAERSARAAAGLGEQVTVAGLSLGGVLAGHLAHFGNPVQRAVLIAPMFGLKRIPGPLHPVLARAAYGLPNRFVWWDPKLKADLPPAHGYPRFATHAYAALFKTASTVLEEARRGAPTARHLSVITNASEPGLDNRFTYQLVELWRGRGAEVETYEFPASDALPHDMIDPAGNPARVTERVYPVVSHFIAGD